MAKMAPLDRLAVVKVVTGNDFVLDRSAPHGDIYRRVSDERRTTIPRTSRIAVPLLKAIQKQTSKDRREFIGS